MSPDNTSSDGDARSARDRFSPLKDMADLILANITDGVFTVDSDFRITFFNRAAEELTGFSREEALGRFCREVFRTRICDQDCPLRRSFRTGEPVADFELEILTRSNDRRPVSVSTAPLADADGRFHGGVETFRDLGPIKSLQRELSGRHVFQDIISKNAGMRRIFDTLPNIAQSDATVLLQGRSGTGKELFANAIHALSARADGPLVKVNCGALPETLLESELFGHVRGAFTDARSERVGRFRAAEGGTILLDEVGDTPLSVQVKLLRVLQHHQFEPVGSEQTIDADVRVISSTNRDLNQLVAAGRFREDLFYRLNVVLVQIPVLRERMEDIPLLVEHFIERLGHRMGRRVRGVSERAMAVLMSHTYPGNVRELENIIERAYVVCAGPTIDVGDLPPSLLRPSAPGPQHGAPVPLSARYRRDPDPEAERARIEAALERHGGSIPRAARDLGMHRTTLWRKLRG